MGVAAAAMFESSSDVGMGHLVVEQDCAGHVF